jgi:hypothetical protein
MCPDVISRRGMEMNDDCEPDVWSEWPLYITVQALDPEAIAP